MFALRKVVDKVLYTLANEVDDTDEMSECMANWADLSYLTAFFKAHEDVLAFYNLSRSEAIELVADQSEKIFLQLREGFKSGNASSSLDHIFQPLHGNDAFDIPVVEAKAYSGAPGEPRMLRLYAIRLQDGCYIFVGGLIKSTLALQDCEEGRALLKKIRSFAKFLRSNGFTDSFEIGELLF